jgi:hypothetical protein
MPPHIDSATSGVRVPVNKIPAVVIGTVVAVFFGMVVAQLLLPALTTGFGTQALASLHGLSAVDLISWFVFLVTFSFAAVILFILTARGNPLEGYRRAIAISLLASLLVIPVICALSLGWILATHPETLVETTTATIFANFLSLPSLAIMLAGDPQVTWILEDICFTLIFLGIFLRKTRVE